MDRIIIIDDQAIRSELEEFLIANQEHIRLNSEVDELYLGSNPTLQEVINLYEKRYKVKIKSKDNIRFYRLKDIIRLESKDNQTCLILINGKTNLIEEPIDEVDKQLVEFPFFRTHPNHLVNLHHISGIKDEMNAKVIMNNGDTVPLSQNQKEIIINSLNKFTK